MGWLQAQGQPGVVDQYVHLRKTSRQLCGQGLHGSTVGHVQFDGQQAFTQFCGQGIQLALATCRGNHLVTRLDKAACHGGTKTCGCTCNENDHGKPLL